MTHRKIDKLVLEQIKFELAVGDKVTKQRLSYFGHIVRNRIYWKRWQC